MSENPYDSIRNQYAQGAIRAVTVVNGAAAVALLSQLSALDTIGIGAATAKAIALHIFGICVGLALWIIGFRSTALGGGGFRLEARSENILQKLKDGAPEGEFRGADGSQGTELADKFQNSANRTYDRANRWANVGLVLFLFSFVCFFAGSVTVLCAYWETVSGQ